MTSRRILNGRRLLVLQLLFLSVTANATAPGWESQYGAELAGLTGADDSAENVVLSFEFPFAGANYTVVSVNSNGGLAFSDDPAVVNVLHWHIWHKNAFQIDFTSAPFPSLLALNTDLDLTSVGTIYFSDFGDRAVFTWDRVATNHTPDAAFASFQIALYPDGHFSYSYLPLEGDPLADLDEGIVVGFSRGQGAIPTGSVDLSATPMNVLDTAYQIWCYKEDPAGDPAASACFDPGQDSNAGFDLDNNLTMLFEPDGSGGYLVSNQPEATPPPPPAPAPPPSVPPTSGGGQTGFWLLALLFISTLVSKRWLRPAQARVRIWQGSHRA